MIYYDNLSWFPLVLRYTGTMWPRTWVPSVLIFMACMAMYCFEDYTSLEAGHAGHTIFGSTMAYFLVFRANTATERYWSGRTYLSGIYGNARELVMVMCLAMRGGAACQSWRESRLIDFGIEDANDVRASMARVNTVRLSIAFLISLKLHTRICHDGYQLGSIRGKVKRLVDLDRLRLRGLVTRSEFEELNELVPIFNEPHVTKGVAVLTPETIEDIVEAELDENYEVDTAPDMRQPNAILMLLRLEITKHTNEPHGMRDRFSKDLMEVCNTLSFLFEEITMSITTPIPFPYVHLCKLMLVTFLMSTPFTVSKELGFFSCVILPTAVCWSLLGIDAIASELADPFGDDPNDLDVTGAISALEDECMKFLDLCGDVRAKGAFMSYRMPGVMVDDDPRLNAEFLCLRSQVNLNAPSRGGGNRKSLVEASFRYSSGLSTMESLGGSVGVGNRGSGGFGGGAAPGGRSSATSGKSARVVTGGWAGGQDGRTGKKSKGKKNDLRTTFEIDEEDESRRPLLQDSDLERFAPMDLRTAESGELEMQGSSLQPDNIGLSESMEEGTAGLKPMSKELLASASPRPEGARRKDRGAFKPLDDDAGGSASGRFRPIGDEVRGSSARGFRPMDEMGTQTIVFEEGDALDDDIDDVVGLSDDEESGDGRPGAIAEEDDLIDFEDDDQDEVFRPMRSHASGSVL